MDLSSNGPSALTHEPLALTWDFQVQVADAPDSGHGWGSAGAGDALLHSPLPTDLHGERAPCKNREGSMSNPEPEAQPPQRTQAAGRGDGAGRAHLARARRRTWSRRCRPRARWGSRRPCRCRPPGPLSGCLLCWGLPPPEKCRHNLQHRSQGLFGQQLVGKGELGACRTDI